MSSIDRRIVQMEFDNKNFESGVSTTISSLQKLQEKLKMKGATDGLDGFNKSLNDISSNNMSGLSSGVETVTAKFSALGVIGMTALSNIANSAINTGKKLVHSLKIEPITSGFSEYETKMGAIQTVLTNTAHAGTSLEDVTKVLNDLNTYADQTIYNFAEMTRNIGTFTAAGVDLDTSAAAIKGIANLAAASGSTSAQASSAMYQLSQALAAGKVSLMDWQSVVTAGMGGKLFQDSLIRTSEMLGTGAEQMIKKYGSFRESLTRGEWLTTEVLTETLKQLSGAYTEADLIAQGFNESQAKQIVELAKNASAAATEVKTVTQLFDTMKESVQSGWAQSWEYIIGDKDQATKFLTAVKDGFDAMLAPSTNARNEMLKFWNEAGGREDVIKGLTNIVQSLGKGFSAVGDAWREVFPALEGKDLTRISAKFADFSKKLKMSDETAKKIKNTFKGVFDVFKTVGSAVGNVLKGFTPLLGIFKNVGSGLLTVTSSIGSFATKMTDAVNRTKIFEKIGNGVKTAFDSIGKVLDSAGDSIVNFFGKLDFSTFGKMLQGVFSGISDIVSPVLDGLGKAIGSVNLETLSNLAKTFVGLGIFKSLKGIFDSIKGIGEGVTDAFAPFKEIGSNIAGILNDTREALTTWQNSLNAGTLIKLALAIGVLAASLVVLSSIDPVNLATALAGMAGLFAELALTMLAINKIGSLKGLVKTSTGMIMISTAILILSAALKNLSGLNMGEVLTGLVAMTSLIGLMAVSLKLFGKSSKDLAKTSVGLIIFGASMHVMASALRQLGDIDPETLGSGLFTLAALMAELAVFLKAANFGGLNVGSATGLLIISAAMIVLSHALKSLGSIQWEEIARGLTVMAGALALIGIAMDAMSELELGSMGVGLAVVSAAMIILSQALKSLGSMQWEEIARGLTAMAGALAIMGIATDVMSELQMVTMAIGIAAMGAALLVLSAALKSMGGQSWEEIAKSLTTLAGALVILGVAMYAMTGCIAGAAAMIVMSVALALFVPQLIALSGLSLAQIGTGLLALAGGLAIIGAAGYLLVGALPGLLGLAASIALFGVGAAAAGAGMALFGTGFAAVAAAIAASGTLILDFIKQLLELLPEIGLKMGEAMVNLAGVIGESAPQVISAFTTLLTAILTAISTNIPAIAQLGMDLILAFGKKLSEGIPQLVNYGMDMILGLLKGIRDRMYEIVDVSLNIVTEFINGIAANIGEVIQSGINLALSFIEGVADGITNNKDRLEAAVRKVIIAMVDAGVAVIKGAYSAFREKGRELLQSFIDGIQKKLAEVKQVAGKIVENAKNGVKNCGTALVQAGKDLVNGFMKGIKDKASEVAKAAKDVVTRAIDAAKNALKINSPSRVFMEIGKYTVEGFAVGLDKYSNKAESASSELANTVIRNVQKPLSSLGQLIDGDIDVDPVITPVMDLSNVESGANKINGLLSNSSITVDSVTGRLAGSIGRIQNRTDNTDVISAIKDLKNSMGSGGTSYTINGITYDDGSNIQSAVETLIRAAMIERRM